MNSKDFLSSAQIIVFNPILQEPIEAKRQYYAYLRRLLGNWTRRESVKAQLSFYRERLCNGKEPARFSMKNRFEKRYCYLLLFDVAAIVGYRQRDLQTPRMNMMLKSITDDFSLTSDEIRMIRCELDAMLGSNAAWDELLGNMTTDESILTFLKTARVNIEFMHKKPYKILLAGTMSAGKSTIINALAGKNVSLTQNMACTGKIHEIISQPIEDNVTSEADGVISIGASHETLMEDNEGNDSSLISVGTYFNGLLGGSRVVLYDSPGVNSSEHPEHTEITEKMVASKKYKLLLYVMNGTTLETEDQIRHLEKIQKRLGGTKILFILNRSDNLISDDDETPASTAEKQRAILEKIGFRKPIICPVSARAAYLIKKIRLEQLSRLEQTELERFETKFADHSLRAYYEDQLRRPCQAHFDDPAEELYWDCGFAYLEEMIVNIVNGGKKNGTGIR